MVARNILAEYINTAVSEIEYPLQPHGLYAPIAYTLDGGGKRIRPVLLLAVCGAMGGDYKDAIYQALGIEMFHNFTLLHDDVMDNADVRRGRPTVHKKWNEATAILSGDAMLTMAAQLMARNAGNKCCELLDVFHRTAMEVYEGQQYDMDFECRSDVAIEEYMEMIRLKTSVLLGCACELGAIMADASEAERKAIYDFGINLGLAFQLQDDWLDTFGNPEIFGKKIGGDILNAKKTYLLMTLLNKLDKPHADWLLSYLKSDAPDQEKIEKVINLYEEYEVGAECREAVEYYGQKAIASLETLNLSAEAEEFFVALVNDSSCRNK